MNKLQLFLRQGGVWGRFFYQVFDGVGGIGPLFIVPVDFAFYHNAFGAVVFFEKLKCFIGAADGRKSLGPDDAAVGNDGGGEVVAFGFIQNIKSYGRLVFEQADESHTGADGAAFKRRKSAAAQLGVKQLVGAFQ